MMQNHPSEFVTPNRADKSAEADDKRLFHCRPYPAIPSIRLATKSRSPHCGLGADAIFAKVRSALCANSACESSIISGHPNAVCKRGT
jgi:hypothetical protein